MTNHRLKSVSWLLLRVVLCAAALGYVFYRTDFYDKVQIEGQKQAVRLVGLDGPRALVMEDGQQESVPVDSLAKDKDGSVHIQWGLLSLARRSDGELLLLAIVLFGIQPLLQVVRFRWMLRLQDLPTDWSMAAGVCFIGNFYCYVIPGTTGGDLVRAGYLMRGQPNRHGALAAIGLDRMTGLAGMLTLAAMAGMILPAQPIVRHVAMAAAVIVLIMVGGFLGIRAVPGIGRLLQRLPLGSHLHLLYEAVSVKRGGLRWLAAAVGLTIVLQAGSMAAFSLAAVALGMKAAWSTYFVCLPISLVVAAIPITPMGLGTMEAAMITLLAGQVGSAGQVLGLAFAMRIIQLLWALPGGLLPFVWSVTPVAETSGR